MTSLQSTIARDMDGFVATAEKIMRDDNDLSTQNAALALALHVSLNMGLLKEVAASLRALAQEQ